MPIDPAELAAAVRVLEAANDLDPEHPDKIALQRATAKLYKTVKKQRRDAAKDAIRSADHAIIAATATGAPSRIDDETQGLELLPAATGHSAGTLLKSQACYVCKQQYNDVDVFYHQLCPECAALNRDRRDARTDLTGKRALLTGGRAKIGMYIALRLLRDGAHTTITTRFPNDAIRRFKAMDDAEDWIHRLRIIGIDLRDPAQVVALADDVSAQGPLDILINNAAQTVRRSPGAYAPLAAAEDAELPAGYLPETLTFGRSHDTHPASLEGTVPTEATAMAHPSVTTADLLTKLALTAGSASLDRVANATAIDAAGLVPDLVSSNSWVQNVEDVDPLELLEVQLCNSTAPFILISRLRESMRTAAADRTYIVNVSAMEGQFSRGYKGPGHPHTNMAKAAVNMLTRTSAREMFETDNILMTSVDTGWITDERPHTTKVRLAEEGFHAPLDLVDGAARVYDPIVRGELGEDVFGCFLKDYKPSAW
ncbi:short chain dehydrogenase [Sanguibacter gelidistatuariae]|uniref:Short chain dehydrogenase n=1 Tax=Sanguibacter gelidistatuariae TaxID=1814289 RepID=A0A1G6H1I9_9MICO|nr:SDR family NAD(P)-dependent oxidoreductase [Sanguibacter gelidistatuariae]SDB88023.1 short chain dehydrogenase [Sanguibacter gelidistatuariae]